jgi:hypothetical protein
MLVLPQTTVNTNNDAEIKGAEVSTDFYVEVTYRLSNIQRTVRAAFTDINKLAQGLTFEMGRQYALTLAFSDTEIKFDISVEPWDADEQLANAATTVVFDANKPAEATEDVEHIHDANSGFIYGQSLPALYYESSLDNTPPSLTKWYFLGYFDSPEGGTQYYKADLNSVEGVTWNKAGPSSTLYAHWTDHLFGRSNIYFQPDLSADLTGNIGSLTFSEDDASKFGYQGLYFKWGSLIGVAAGNNSSYDSTDTGTYLYIPALGTGKYYKVRAGLVSVNYTDGNSEKQKAVQAYANSTANKDGRWTDIPFVDGGNDLDDIPDLGESTAIERAEHRLTERSTDADLFKYYKGDICKFLSDKKGSNGSGLTRTWVMPKSEVWKGEYHGLPYTDLSGWSYTWKDGSLTNTTPDGTDISGVYLIYTTVSKEEVNFPAAGYRSGGTLNSVGFYGGYWSSSVGSASLAFDLYFSSDYVIPDDNSAYRAGGFPVRCVQEF